MQPQLSSTSAYGLPAELQGHFGINKDYFGKLLCKDFSSITTHVTSNDVDKIKNAYDASHRIREFEIGLYWQRLNYLWAITAVFFAGWGVIVFKILEDVDKSDPFLYYSVSLISIFGSILAIFTNFIVNAGKHWQTVWEYHITRLEPFISGSLYAMKFKPNGNSKQPSISKTLELFNRFILFFWFGSAIVFAIAPFKNDDAMVQWIQIGIYVIVVGAFWLISKNVTKKNTYKVDLMN